MSASQDSHLPRLEAALDRWQKQIAGAHLAFTDQINGMQERLSKLLQCDFARPTPVTSVEAPTEPQEPPASELRQRIQALESMLEEERERAGHLDARIKSAVSHQEVDSLAERLGSAIRDRDEAHQEIVSLRSQLAMLHKANAALASGSPALNANQGLIEVVDADGNRLRFGEILVKLKLTTPERISTALEEQKGSHRRIGAILQEQGIVSEALVSQIVARQLDLPFVKLTPDVVDEAAPGLISSQLARQRNCLPIAVSPERIIVAMANPFDLVAMDDVESATGRKVAPAVATPSDVEAALRKYYGKP
jgi:hypothetical protein